MLAFLLSPSFPNPFYHLDNLKAELDPTLRTPLDQMHFPWLDLLQADEEYLAVCVDYHVAVGTGQPTWGTIPIGLLLHANQTLVNLLQDELLRHPSSPITKVVSFRNVRLELAGIIIKYFFPLPHLQRLSRPFRFEAFLPFLITYPSMQLVPPTFPQP
ncbi:hypothetical protein JCM11251_002332 [Rhodosporidiobolus azoricus]